MPWKKGNGLDELKSLISGPGCDILKTMDQEQNAYCICCGEDVPVEITSIGIVGEDLLRCKHCGAYLGTTKKPQTLADPAPPLPGPMPQEPLPGPEFSPDESAVGVSLLPEIPKNYSPEQKAEAQIEPPAAPGSASDKQAEILKPPIEAILVAEDSELLLLMLKDMLIAKGLARKVTSCTNGFETVSTYIRIRKANIKPGLVIMDVKMPLLNGIAAAVALRAYEKGMDIAPVPILFFTSKRCDETFRKALSYCRPAMYVNKGASESAHHLQERVDKVIDQLLEQEW
jgi:CheY-like chemotaxis protein